MSVETVVFLRLVKSLFFLLSCVAVFIVQYAISIPNLFSDGTLVFRASIEGFSLVGLRFHYHSYMDICFQVVFQWSTYSPGPNFIENIAEQFSAKQK